MPKLWNDTIEEHRRAVHVAILDTTASLVAEHGLTSVTMSQIAQATGIGRANLYKYFPDVEAIMMAWHERQVTGHLHHLAALRDQGDDPARRLSAVLHAYAPIQREHRGHELAALLHRGAHMPDNAPSTPPTLRTNARPAEQPRETTDSGHRRGHDTCLSTVVQCRWPDGTGRAARQQELPRCARRQVLAVDGLCRPRGS